MRIASQTWIRPLAAGLLALGIMIGPASARAGELRVEVNGRLVRLGYRHQAYLDRGVWMIPARPVLDAARVSHFWDARRQELEVWSRFERMVVAVGSYTVWKYGGRRDILSRPIAMHHGEPYAPVDFLELCLDTKASYDRRYEILSFGRSWWQPPRTGWEYGDPWDRHRWDPDHRREYDRYRPLTLECPAITYSRAVRIEGYWNGTSVRVRVLRLDGKETIDRTAVPRDGRWSMELHLSRGVHKVIAEGREGGAVRETQERRLDVR